MTRKSGSRPCLTCVHKDATTALDAFAFSRAYLVALYASGYETLRSLIGLVFEHRAGRSDPEMARF